MVAGQRLPGTQAQRSINENDRIVTAIIVRYQVPMVNQSTPSQRPHGHVLIFALESNVSIDSGLGPVIMMSVGRINWQNPISQSPANHDEPDVILNPGNAP